MAEQINSKLNAQQQEKVDNNNSSANGTSSSSASTTHQHSNESVDLDNLFAFLSEVTPNANSSNTIIDEIGEKMNNLVDDLDFELESVIQQEIEGLTNERNNNNSNKMTGKGMGIPTLPEPTMPPPPPPIINGNSIAPPVPVVAQTKRTEEPIYEAVIHHKDFALPSVPEVNEAIPPPPPPHAHAPQPVENGQHAPPPPVHAHQPPQSLQPAHKLRPKSPAVIRSASPSHRLSSGSTGMAPSSPKHSRPSSRASSTAGSGLGTAGHPFGEREQRRKYRVEKKLQEMQQMDVTEREKELVRDDMYYDILEFAESYYNTHERSPEGTIIATLTRKGRKSVDMVPKYEMIAYYRGNSIPSSHIHMYDPENVSIACNIFKDLCKYIRGELNAERELQVIQYIIRQGIEREELRDEILVQCMRQATNNPHSEWTDRVWLLLCLTIVAFQPSKLLFRYFVSFLRKNLESLDGKLRQYVQWCLDNCKNTKVSSRQHAPSSVEVAVS
jgi:MyTH4 domain